MTGIGTRALFAALAAAVTLAGCEAGVEEDDGRLEPAADTAAEAPFEEAHERQRVVIQAASFSYTPNAIEVAPGPVTFVVTNAADIEHGFEVEGQGLERAIETIASGSTDSLTVTFEQPGEYTLYCPVGNHQDRGMTGTVTVGG